ncbi:hypothetical protein [Campylobacter sp.]|uniref:hypothetical protein n=1 Tax=Campylobacter sp. TaxID=205 RepID=UPI0026DD7432|nr:hypothetical protein [Campylobacter sp.]MDO4673624.1 hypothetical protein [Campylobacter sp.]
MKKIYLTIFCLVLFCGCESKRQYFEPAQTDGALSFDAYLGDKIIDWNSNAAKLNKGVIYKGIIPLKLGKNENLLAYQDGEFVIADNEGNLKILNERQEEIHAHKFDSSVVSARLDGDDLALVLASNSIVLADRNLRIKFSQDFTPAPTRDNRAAAPIFLNQLIIYPTLDGRLIIFSRDTGQILNDVVVSAADFFNNVLHLSVFEDRMIAATSHKIIIISPQKTFHLDAQIKDVITDGGDIFILCKDGNIIKADLRLNKILEKKFDFAIFNKAQIYEGFLYIFEKKGYLIKSDLNLANIQTFKLQAAVDKMSFMGDGKFYYDDKILNLP